MFLKEQDANSISCRNIKHLGSVVNPQIKRSLQTFFLNIVSLKFHNCYLHSFLEKIIYPIYIEYWLRPPVLFVFVVLQIHLKHLSLVCLLPSWHGPSPSVAVHVPGREEQIS